MKYTPGFSGKHSCTQGPSQTGPFVFLALYFLGIKNSFSCFFHFLAWYNDMLFTEIFEGGQAGDLPRNRFLCTLTLFGSRGKVVALEKLRIPSPNTKKCQGAEHRSNRLAAICLVTRWARPEKKTFFAKVNYSQRKMSTFGSLAPPQISFNLCYPVNLPPFISGKYTPDLCFQT